MVRLAARLLVAIFCWVTMAYAIVASSTFAYLQFLRPAVFPWTATVATWHAAAGWPWLLLLAAVLRRDLRQGGAARGVAAVLLALCALAVGWNAWHPVLPALRNDRWSLLTAVLALVPVLTLALLDVWRAWPGASRSEADGADLHETRLMRACLATASTLTAVFAVVALLRLSLAFEPEFTFGHWAAAVLRSAAAHLTVWVMAFLGTALVGRLRSVRTDAELPAFSAALVGLLAFVFAGTVGAALDLAASARALLGITLSASIVGTWAGIRLCALRGAGGAYTDALGLYFGTAAGAQRPQWIVGVAMIGAGAAGLARLAAWGDWDDLLLHLGTVVLWICAFGWVWRRVTAARPTTTRLVVLTGLAPLALWSGLAGLDAASMTLDRYARYDPSFHTARSLLRRSDAREDAFHRYLEAHTGLTDVAVRPRDLDLVQDLGPAANRPLVFLFVIDSLRADYLGAYNPQVSFTPGFDAFARESLVFANAFTRYGGTGLSVPAIWAGAVLPHKQYVTPFHPMNTLEKLLDVNAYRRFVSLDSIMAQLLEPSPLLDELDRGRPVMDYELCRTLGELESRLRTAAPADAVFAYSLPQDIHMSRLSRWTSGATFEGFFSPYAARIQAMDACFGRFIAELKRLGLYERSLIVLTADHGEMLGEDGQHGHSYHMGPTVVRVPLIIHLPRHLAGVAADTSAIALSTDITPTIYAALGYRLDESGALVGRPLIGMTEAQLTRRRREFYVLSASYGAVYAAVRDNGRQLFVVDAVKGQDRLYERSPAGTWSERPIAADVRAIAHLAIRQHIDEVARTYNLPRHD